MPKESYGIWPNEGQVTDLDGNAVPDISFYTSGALPRAYFRKSGLFSLVLGTGDSVSVDTLRRLDVACVGPHANYPDPIVWVMKDQYANFYLPQCGPNGATQVHPYRRVIYPEMYPLIDMHVYSGQLGQKLAFVVNPGGDPKDIQLQFTGQDQLDVDVYGNLKIMLQDKWVTLPEAVAYQVEDDGTISWVNWTAEYEVYDGQATARLNFDAFDHNKPLVFLIGPPALGGGDPYYEETGLCWSTYYGGDELDYPKHVEGDQFGNVYVVGRTESAIFTFPSNVGITYQPEPEFPNLLSSRLATLSKFDVNNQLQWTCFIGGVAEGDLVGPIPKVTNAVDLAVRQDPIPSIYIIGSTTSPEFYTHYEDGAYLDLGNFNAARKGFIAKFDAFGNALWSTIYGENTTIQAIDLFDDDQIVVSGISGDGLDMPPPPSSTAFSEPYHGGTSDGFFMVFTPSDNLYWGSYYGGSGKESYMLVGAHSSNMVVAGETDSQDIETVQHYGESYILGYQGGQDCFLAALKGVGPLEWATYLGGAGDDRVGPKGLVYSSGPTITLVGNTEGLPDLVNGSNWYDNELESGLDNGYIARFGQYYQPQWISYLGSGTSHFAWCLDVSGGITTVGGYSNDQEFEPVQRAGFYYQPAYQPDNFGGFLTQFDAEQHRILNTHFGGLTEGLVTEHIPENVSSIRTINGSLYVVGYTEKRDMPVNTYFPLDNQTDDPWFTDLFNGAGLDNHYNDGYIAAMCYELNVGLDETNISRTGIHVIPDAAGRFRLAGLQDGTHQLRIYDARGRLVADRQVRSMAGRTEAVQVDLGSALYLLRVDGNASVKYFPLQ
jgi:hypothetical protein